MIPFPEFDPVIAQLGPIAVRWYGLMYVLGFYFVWTYSRGAVFHKRDDGGEDVASDEALADLLSYLAVGVLVGGRVIYMLIYKSTEFWQSPFKVFAVWEGGMSFHGGLIGVLVGLYFFCRAYGYTYASVLDTLARISAPTLGQHTESVLLGLGYTESEINRLLSDNVIKAS